MCRAGPYFSSWGAGRGDGAGVMGQRGRGDGNRGDGDRGDGDRDDGAEAMGRG